MTLIPETDDIAQIRDDIDRVDAEIMRLLAERRGHSRRMAVSKTRANRPYRDRNREEDIIASRLIAATDHNLDAGLVVQLWRAIMHDSVRLQEETLHGTGELRGGPVVSIQGIQGSYSHLASEEFFAANGVPAASYLCAPTISQAVENLAAGNADTAVLPIENSTSGAITEVYDALLESELYIVGDIELRVRHCLLGMPGASPAEVTKIYGHPQAVAQCSEFIAALEDCEVVYFSDTALSGKRIAELDDPSIAAIASEEAARLFGLEVLKTGIANQQENTTRFVVVAATPAVVPSGVPAKTSVVMSTGNRPGALMEALSVFRDGDINLVKLESRPKPDNPREESFYLDFEGSSSDQAVADVIDALTRRVRFLRVLGSYPSRDLRERPITAWVDRVDRGGKSGITGIVTPMSTRTGYRLGSRDHKQASTVVEVSGVEIGAENLVIIAGPCAVESWDQLVAAARAVRDAGASILRGGCFKPRTSPYSFQGLGFEGLEMLAEVGRTFGLPVVTEVMTPEHMERIAEKSDILQIGTRNMSNFALLQAVGRARRPVLLKRGMSSSIEEFLQAAEYVLAEGNQQVILCERGIRTFETATRNTLDLSAVPVLKSRTHLPVIVDPSHAAGARELVPPLALAAQAVGADGIMVEVHPDPDHALSDGRQSLQLDQFRTLMGELGFSPRS